MKHRMLGLSFVPQTILVVLLLGITTVHAADDPASNWPSPKLLSIAPPPPAAQEETTPRHADEGELAKKLSNPISSLISVPFQSNFDFNTGQRNGWKYTLNVQPVIPISISEDWNLIVRTIVPVAYQENVVDDGGWCQFGLSDTTQSFFLSPKQSDPIWGIGPVFLWPTGTNDSLGSQKWGAGPTIVVLKQEGHWTYGILANHIWSFAGDDVRRSVNATFLQPFLAYNTAKGFGVSVNTESTYDWTESQWTVPVGIYVSQVLRIGKQPVSIQFGPRFYLDGPVGAPDWGLRLNFTLLFPK